tara:strand:- start:32 stop:448 length:417 start_codon:yes stop_codon:yes gene_type:complete
MYLQFKKLKEEALVPDYANQGDAGLDLTAISLKMEDGYWEYGTGLSIEIPKGFVGLLFPRSSISKKDQFLRNSVGVIDSGYRGEVKLRMSVPAIGESYGIGEKIGQLIILEIPMLKVIEVDELDESERGAGGFGSSGK